MSAAGLRQHKRMKGSEPITHCISSMYDLIAWQRQPARRIVGASAKRQPNSPVHRENP
jgi:hypothetical protein